MSSDEEFGDNEQKEVNIKSMAKEESILFWRNIQDTRDVKIIRFFHSNFKDDLEVNLPKFIKNNPKVSDLTLEFKETIQFDPKSLTESLTGMVFEDLILESKSKMYIDFSIILNCFKYSKIQNLCLKQLTIDEKFLEILSSRQNIEKLFFNYCSITSFDKKLLFNIQKVEIIFCFINNVSTFFYQFLLNCLSLKSLKFRSKVDELDMEMLYHSLKDKNLTKLTFHNDLSKFQKIDYFKKLLNIPFKTIRMLSSSEMKLDFSIFK